MDVQKKFLAPLAVTLSLEQRDATPPMQIVWLPIDEVKPYFRNARKNEATVRSVKVSISEFGVKRPLVVDRDLVLVVGHAQQKAMRELKYSAVPVIFSKYED